MSSQGGRGGGKNCQFYLVERQLRGGEGVKNCRFWDNIVYGWPLKRRKGDFLIRQYFSKRSFVLTERISEMQQQPAAGMHFIQFWCHILIYHVLRIKIYQFWEQEHFTFMSCLPHVFTKNKKYSTFLGM